MRVVEAFNSASHQCSECCHVGIRYRLYMRSRSYELCEDCIADLVAALDAIGNPGHTINRARAAGSGE